MWSQVYFTVEVVEWYVHNTLCSDSPFSIVDPYVDVYFNGVYKGSTCWCSETETCSSSKTFTMGCVDVSGNLALYARENDQVKLRLYL